MKKQFKKVTVPKKIKNTRRIKVPKRPYTPNSRSQQKKFIDYKPLPVPYMRKKLSIGGSQCENKIAFLFLTIESLHQGEIWYQYLKEAGHRCNLYTHAKLPQHIQQEFLRDTQIPNTVPTGWANISLVHATNRLILEALRDPTNKYLMLVSEKCIPIRPFDDFYDYTFKNEKSSIFWYHWNNRPNQNATRYRKLIQAERGMARSMSLDIKPARFVKQSQWMLLRRDHATFCVHNNYTSLFRSMPAPDEHYYINVLKSKFKGFDMGNINYPITHVNWRDSTKKAHPLTYTTLDVKKLLKTDSSQLFNASIPYRKVYPPESEEPQSAPLSFFARKVDYKTKVTKLNLKK